MFNKILIANRGEIACRIIRTAKKLGIKTVAIYSDADMNALHVLNADEAYYVGKAPSRDSYLQTERILHIAQDCQAEAIHPGYGFLSENAQFAEQCEQAGIVFIGPPASAIRAMGSKSAAKSLMEQVKVPLIPGYHGDNQELTTFVSAAKSIGYPVLLKAAAGGGGKGMRTIWNEAEFAEAFASAKREALASFSDDKMLLEKYLTKPRHVEIQVFADHFKNYVYLFERDCSIQRRHQKVLEEAPAPNMPPALREKMGQAALQAARVIDYVGAGTVEFLLDENEQFYFMEMNTRLQVEHPVTEMITGLDLVEWQFKVAAKQTLPLTQEQLMIRGHAVETRIYAEDPNNQFLPSIGKLNYFKTPEKNNNVRIDSAVTENDLITPYYDPMIAKLITFAETRAEALSRMQRALNQFHIVGVKTNIAFLGEIISHPDFMSGNFDTGFIEKHAEELFVPKKIPNFILATACLYRLLKQAKELTYAAQQNCEPNSPWFSGDQWRLNLAKQQLLQFIIDNEELVISVSILNDCFLIHFPSEQFKLKGHLASHNELVVEIIEQQKIQVTVIEENTQLHLFFNGTHYQLEIHNPNADFEKQEESGGGLNAPMPGTVVALLTEQGKTVNRGDKLIVIEAMKMEHTIHSPKNGIVKTIHYKVGDMVSEGAELLTIET